MDRISEKFDKERFLDELLAQHWDYVYFFGNDPNTTWEIWKDLFLEVLDKHAPLQQKKIRSNKIPWITSQIKSLIITRDKLKIKATISKSVTDWENYKAARNEVNIKLRNAKQNYYSTKIAHGQKCNPKEAWKKINNLLGKKTKQTIVNELDMNKNIVQDPQEIVEGFNEYFSNMGPNLASNIAMPNLQF